MEKFAVDLDKVLDDFELDEDRAAEIEVVREMRLVGVREFKQAIESSSQYSTMDRVTQSQAYVESSTGWSTPIKSQTIHLPSITMRYDIPYEPAEALDLSDANFGPSPLTSNISRPAVVGRDCENGSGVNEQCTEPAIKGNESEIPINSNSLIISSELNSSSHQRTDNPSNSLSLNGHIRSTDWDETLQITKANAPHLPSPSTGDVMSSNASLFQSSVVYSKDIGESDEHLANRLMEDIEKAMSSGEPLPAAFKCNIINKCSDDFSSEALPTVCVINRPTADGCKGTVLGGLERKNGGNKIQQVQQDGLLVPSRKLLGNSVDAESGESCKMPNNIESRKSKSEGWGVESESHRVPNPIVTKGNYETLFETVAYEIDNDKGGLLLDKSNDKKVPVADINVCNSSTLATVIPRHHDSGFAPVGFSQDVDLTDEEMEKYLNEADSLQTYDGNMRFASSDQPSSHSNTDEIRSGQESHALMAERSASQLQLSSLDPYYNDPGSTIQPDQSYEDVRKQLEDTFKATEPTRLLSESDAGFHRARDAQRLEEAFCKAREKKAKQAADQKVGIKDQLKKVFIKNDLIGVKAEEMKPVAGESSSSPEHEKWSNRRLIHDTINRERAENCKVAELHLTKEQKNLQIKNQLMSDGVIIENDSDSNRIPQLESKSNMAKALKQSLPEVDYNPDYMIYGSEGIVQDKVQPENEERSVLIMAGLDDTTAPRAQDDDVDCTDVENFQNGTLEGLIGRDEMSDEGGTVGLKRQRPTSLNLSGKIEVLSNRPQEQTIEPNIVAEPDSSVSAAPPECSELSEPSEGAYPWEGSEPYDGIAEPPTPMLTEEELHLGKVAPFWVPDAEAPNCMQCETKFTVLKRRHHCRACGKVLCAQCCGLKAKLPYMDNKEARVCQQCLVVISKVQGLELRNESTSTPLTPTPTPTTPTSSSAAILPPSFQFILPLAAPGLHRPPNPNNPNEYCSTVPPLQQVQANLNAPPPTVMVPVGVLKREGTKTRGEPKQVMFSDGIRPGGDLAELDDIVEPKPPYRRQGRIQKKLEKITAYTLDSFPSSEQLFTTLQDENASPVVFAVNKNFYVKVKIVNLSCCVNRICWSFVTSGMYSVGQEEVVVLLECLPDERTVPKDLFFILNNLYVDALNGTKITELGHTIISTNFLASREHGGMLFVRPSFQCLEKLYLPPLPFLVGILLQKWETPWAKVFPIRLMLRLGFEFRYYPCPLFSVRFRKPVYGEIGHTIMNLLADFRNYQYMLPSIRGLMIHMEDKQTFINFPKNRYDETMKALNNSNDHVLALGGNFSKEADSHLVCNQTDEGTYQTQAINIQNKPRKVTAGSYVVFNGALKSSSGLTAKSSIVEDGLMVQIPPDTMLALRQAIRDMRDFTIGCGPIGAEQPEEVVFIQWTEDDRNVNIGVKSPIDGMSMDGISSITVQKGIDFMSEPWLIRWTEVFLIQTDDALNRRRSDPVDISRLSDTLAQACCLALTSHLGSLQEAGYTKIGLRVTIDAENVGYEVGSLAEKLPAIYMNDLDSELVPVIHRAASHNQEGPVVVELIFHVLEQ